MRARGRESHSSQSAVPGSGKARCLMKAGRPGSSSGTNRQEMPSMTHCGTALISAELLTTKLAGLKRFVEGGERLWHFRRALVIR